MRGSISTAQQYEGECALPNKGVILNSPGDFAVSIYTCHFYGEKLTILIRS